MLLAAALISCQPQEKQTKTTESSGDGIFIHLSAGPESPHRVLMALKMAEIMSADKDVLIYLDINAVHLVVQGAPEVSMEGFPSSREQIGKLLEAGVTLQACPTCLKVAGYTPENLLEGVMLANKENFFTFTDGRIISIDY